MEQSLERLEKEMPGYYIQFIPAFISALSLSIAAILSRDEIVSPYRITLYILIFLATNFLFHKSLLRILSQFLMKQAIKDRDLSVLVLNNKAINFSYTMISIVTIVMMNVVLWYVWVEISNLKADLFLLIVLTLQFFKGIQAKLQFNHFLKGIAGK